MSQPPYYGQQPQPGYGAPPPGGAPHGGAPPAGYPATSPNPGAPYYPPPGQAAGQQYPPGQQGHQQPYYGYTAPPPGAPPAGQYQSPPPGQPGQPGQYQPPPGQPGQYQPPPGQPGQYQNQPYPQQPPQGAYGQPPQAAPYGQQPPQSAPYGQPPQNAPYGQAPPPGQYGAQPPYGQPPPAGYPQQPPPGAAPGQWQQPPAPNYAVQATPASQGYDVAQKAWVQPVNTFADAEALRKAMKGMGCDERALIRVLTSPQYSNPWAMAQLVQDYNTRFIRNLADDIKSETRSGLETALLALIRGPLGNDVHVLDKSLNRLGTDEDGLMDVLLCRSNADIRAIAAEYKRVKNKELIVDIKEDVDGSIFRMYSMIMGANRTEDAAPVLPHEIDQKITEVQRATEGMVGANAVSVAQIFVSSNGSQLSAMADAYQRKYHRGLQDVIEKEFRGDMEDALLRMLTTGQNRPYSDAFRLREALTKGKNDLLINRVAALYWDRPRMDAAKEEYRKRYGGALSKHVRDYLKGDLETVLLGLVGK